MFIRIATLGVTFAVAVVGIFLNASDIKVKLALAALAAASFVLAVFIEIQATRDTNFAKHALERLIQASTPSDVFAKAVTQLVIDEGMRHGLNQCVVIKRKHEDGNIWRVVFTDEDGRRVRGYFEFDHEQLARWSLLDESRLSDEVEQDMFKRGPMLTADPKENWSNLVDFIASVGRGLYPDAGGERFGVSADFDAAEIGLPYPPGVPSIPGRTKQLTMGGKRVPFLVFSREELGTLARQPYVTASQVVAGWLEDSWGAPTSWHS